MCDPTPSSPRAPEAVPAHTHSPGCSAGAGAGAGAGPPASPRTPRLRPPSALDASAFTCGICLADEVEEAGVLDSCDHR